MRNNFVAFIKSPPILFFIFSWVFLIIRNPIPPFLDAIGHAAIAQIPFGDGTNYDYYLSFSYRLVDLLFRIAAFFGIDSIYSTGVLVWIIFLTSFLVLFFLISTLIEDKGKYWYLWFVVGGLYWSLPTKQFFWGAFPFECALLWGLIAALSLQLRYFLFSFFALLAALSFHPVGFIYSFSFFFALFIVQVKDFKIYWKYWLISGASASLILFYNMNKFGNTLAMKFEFNGAFKQRVFDMFRHAFNYEVLVPELTKSIVFSFFHHPVFILGSMLFFLFFLISMFKLKTRYSKVFLCLGLIHTFLIFFLPLYYRQIGEWPIRSFFIHGLLIGAFILEQGKGFLNVKSLYVKNGLITLMIVISLASIIELNEVGSIYRKLPQIIDAQKVEYLKFLVENKIESNQPIVAVDGTAAQSKYGWQGRISVFWLGVEEHRSGRSYLMPEWLENEEQLPVLLKRDLLKKIHPVRFLSQPI